MPGRKMDRRGGGDEGASGLFEKGILCDHDRKRRYAAVDIGEKALIHVSGSMPSLLYKVSALFETIHIWHI